jgi:hypothetical protein
MDQALSCNWVRLLVVRDCAEAFALARPSATASRMSFSMAPRSCTGGGVRVHGLPTLCALVQEVSGRTRRRCLIFFQSVALGIFMAMAFMQRSSHSGFS